MQDLDRAGTELERRLTESVHADDGIVVIHQPDFGPFRYVLSANTPWTLTCGVGIAVVFGSAVSGDSGNVSNDVEVRLAYNSVDDKTCASLGPRLGKKLKAIFREAASAS
jgi:hypothetical protein